MSLIKVGWPMEQTFGGLRIGALLTVLRSQSPLELTVVRACVVQVHCTC